MAGTIRLENAPSKYAIVDEEDYDKMIALGRWHINENGYAVRRYHNHSVRMHRIIADTPEGLHTDHINRDKLDNRKANLRTVSAAMNAMNGSGNNTKKVYKDLPKGITFDYSRKKYVATRVLRKRFNTLEEAIKFTVTKEFEL
jgi:hypothetical protein